MTTSEKPIADEAQDELAALDALEKEASEFNKVPPTPLPPDCQMYSILTHGSRMLRSTESSKPSD